MLDILIENRAIIEVKATGQDYPIYQFNWVYCLSKNFFVHILATLESCRKFQSQRFDR